MYLINKSENRIHEISKKSFSELGFRERDHLQEWIANNPECLGEELLIIQKEFDGFNETNERLDLLALDKQGNLVVIENKLDDSGRDVTWQSLKYASYCSSLTKNQLKDVYQKYLDKQGSGEVAADNLSEFFGNTDYSELQLNQGTTQRIIMIAGSFRKEVTSTVLWLMNYKLRIQCIKVTPYKHGENLFLDIEQIIPMKDAEDFVISMAEKAQEEVAAQETMKNRHRLRLDFWTRLLKEMSPVCERFRNISPRKDNWLGIGSGVSGITYNTVVSNQYARIEVYILRNTTIENKAIFDWLYLHKDEVEKLFGAALTWERLDSKKASRIKFQHDNLDYFNEENWGEMIQFMVEWMPKLENAFKEYVKRVANEVLK